MDSSILWPLLKGFVSVLVELSSVLYSHFNIVNFSPFVEETLTCSLMVLSFLSVVVTLKNKPKKIKLYQTSHSGCPFYCTHIYRICAFNVVKIIFTWQN